MWKIYSPMRANMNMKIIRNSWHWTLKDFCFLIRSRIRKILSMHTINPHSLFQVCHDQQSLIKVVYIQLCVLGTAEHFFHLFRYIFMCLIIKILRLFYVRSIHSWGRSILCVDFITKISTLLGTVHNVSLLSREKKLFCLDKMILSYF